MSLKNINKIILTTAFITISFFILTQFTCAQIQCPTGCECLTEAQAKEKFNDNYEKCSEDACGYEYSQTITAAIKIPKYCFKQKTTTITIIKPATIVASNLSACPQGCECLTDAQAKEKFGSYVKCTEDVCGYEIAQRITAVRQIPKYCFGPKEVIIKPPLTRPLPLPESPCTCHSCLECSDMLEGSCETVYLGNNIHGGSSQCITFSETHKTFDCQGYEITGGAVGQEFYYGIFAGGNDITIQNCEVSEFEVGIDIHHADGVKLINNTLHDNYASGMYIANSEDIDIEGNNFEYNGDGVHLADTQNTHFGGNRICKSEIADIYSSPWSSETGSTRDNNVCDLIFNWNDNGWPGHCDEVCNAGASTSVGTPGSLQGALDGEYGTVDLTNDINAPDGLDFKSSHVALNCNGHTISGSGSGTGIMIENKINIELHDCIIEDFDTGVELRGGSLCSLTGNTIRNNDYGLVFRSSEMPSVGSTIDDNDIKPNGIYGVYINEDVHDNSFTSNDMMGSKYSLFVNGNCDNEVDTTNRGSHGVKIGYFHDAAGLNIDSGWGDRSFSEVVICNVKDSEFHGMNTNNVLTNSDGVLIIDSENLELTSTQISSSHQGVSITNSSNIDLLSTNIYTAQEGCIALSQSSGVTIEQGNLRGCKIGIDLAFSDVNTIERLEIGNMSVAGIRLYDSGSNDINRVSMIGNSNSSNGVMFLETSNGNTLYLNNILNFSNGVNIDSTSDNNSLSQNIICDNQMDILNRGEGNTGNINNCTKNSVWIDDGVGRGCYSCCSNIRSDVDGDGIDDACDCNDVWTGNNEHENDCGGRCPDCVDCTWCDSSIEPLRIRGRPNSGYIDIVFVPMNNWDLFPNFTANAAKVAREKYLGLKMMSTEPVYSGYEDMFNFYIYTGGEGKNSDKSESCYNPEGPEDWLCIGCKGWLPGEQAYLDWLVSCSVTCALTLGLGCGCFAYEPNHFWEHASFADSVGILSSRWVRGCSGFGPTSHYKSSFCGDDATHGNVVLHETGHSLFALTDTYCGDTSYSRAGNVPNVWTSQGRCQSNADLEGWGDGICVDIYDGGDCSSGKYRYDSNDGGIYDIMDVTCNKDSKFREASMRRINYVFEHWPSGGSMGVINYIMMRGDNMSHMMSRVMPNHPDLGMWMSDFSAVTQSAAGDKVDEFSFGDPRLTAVSDIGVDDNVFSEDTYFPVTVPLRENVRWLHIFNGSSGDEMVVIDMGPAIWNYCEEEDWVDDYCKTIDLNDNGVLDYLEDWSLEEAMDVMGEEAPAAEAPEIEGEPYVPPEEPTTQEEAQGEEPSTFDIRLLLIAAGAIILILIIIIFVRRK